MKFFHDGIDFNQQQVFEVMGKPLPILDKDVDITEAYRVLLSGTTGIIVTEDEIPIGVVTRVDLISYWATQNKI